MNEKFYIKSYKSDAYLDIADYLYNLISQNILPNQEIVIVCIGTSHVIFDSLGPMVGYFLKKYDNNICVYGSNEYLVHAENLKETIDIIYKMHNNPFVIAVDASLGIREHIGQISISNGPLEPGKGIGKNLDKIGDISITGVTSSKDLLIQKDIFGIIEMAKCIALGINYTNRYLLPPKTDKSYDLSYFEYNY